MRRELDSAEEFKLRHKKKKGFFKSVTKLLSGSSRTKKKREEDISQQSSNQLILDHENPKLFDMDIVKTSAKEYDPSSLCLPNTEQIKAKLIAVDKYYGFDKKSSNLKEERTSKSGFQNEKEKERPSWGYIMERPLLEQYVLMNNYIRKASVLAELENIEEQEKTGNVRNTEIETDTDISLLSDYENELKQYKEFSLMKDSLDVDFTEQENKPSHSADKIKNSRKIFKGTDKQTVKKSDHKICPKYRDSKRDISYKRVTFAKTSKYQKDKSLEIKCPSDSDPPIAYNYLSRESLIPKRSVCQELEDCDVSPGSTYIEKRLSSKYKTSAIEKFATKFGIIQERKPSNPISIEDDESESSDSSDDSFHINKAGNSPQRSMKPLSGKEPPLQQPKEQTPPVGKSTRMFEDSNAVSEDSPSVEEDVQISIHPSPNFQKHDHLVPKNENQNMNSPEVEHGDTFQEEPVPEEFKPKYFISPMEVLRIQAEEMKKDNNVKDYDINDKLAMSLTGRKKAYNFKTQYADSTDKNESNKGNKRESTKMMNLIKDFGKFEPIPTTSTSPADAGPERKSFESQVSNVQTNPVSSGRSSINRGSNEMPTLEEDQLNGLRRQKGKIEIYVESLKSNGLGQIAMIRKTPSMEIVEAEKRRLFNNLMLEEKKQVFRQSLNFDEREGAIANERHENKRRSQSLEIENVKSYNDQDLDTGKRSQSLDIQLFKTNLISDNFGKERKHPSFQLKESVSLDEERNPLESPSTRDYKIEKRSRSEIDRLGTKDVEQFTKEGTTRWKHEITTSEDSILTKFDCNQVHPENESLVLDTDIRSSSSNLSKGVGLVRSLNSEGNLDLERNSSRVSFSMSERSFPFRGEAENKKKIPTVISKMLMGPEIANDNKVYEVDERKSSIIERSQAIFDVNKNNDRSYGQDVFRKKSEDKFNKLMKHPYLDLVPDERKKQLHVRMDERLHSLQPDEFTHDMRQRIAEDRRRKSQFSKQ